MMTKGLKRKIRKRHQIIESAILKNSTGVTKVKYNGKVYNINSAKYIDAMMEIRNFQWTCDKAVLFRCAS